MPKNTDLIGLSSYAEGGDELHVIIETPKGSRNKFNYDEEHGLFKLGGVLPAALSSLSTSASSPQLLAAMATLLTCCC